MDHPGGTVSGAAVCAVMTALMLAGCAITGAPASGGGRVSQDPELERAVEVFLTECLQANVDDVAKMKAALGVAPIETQGQGAGLQMDNRLGQTVTSLLDERRKNRTDPLRLIKQEYVDSPGPYWNQAVLLLKVMGYKCLETEAL
jgi:hypothetical protein